MELNAVQRIGIVGGGVMGGGIAQVLALAGYRVTIRDLTQQILDETRAEVVDRKWSLKRSVERGKLGFDLAVAAIERIGYTLTLDDLRECDLVIEAVPEKLELKQRVFGELDSIIKSDAILASNTSGFPDLRHRQRASGEAPAAVRRHALLEPGAGDADVRSHLHAADQSDDDRHRARCGRKSRARGIDGARRTRHIRFHPESRLRRGIS